jgi:hypothetical protein
MCQGSRVPRRDPLVLVGTGAGLLAAAFLGLLVVFVTTAGSYDWPDDAVVPTDGAAHTVSVPAGREVLLWTGGGGAADCTLRDPGSDSALETRPAPAAYPRHEKIADWEASAAVTPSGSRLEVVCRGSGEGFVGVQAAPRFGGALDGVSRWYAVPLVLALAGLVALGSAVLSRARPGTP